MSVLIARSQSFYPNVQPSSSGCSPAVFIQRVIPVGTSLDVDALPTADFLAAKWYIVLTTSSGSRTRSYELLATQRNGINASFTYYSIIGDQILHTPAVNIVGGNIVLSIQNDDFQDLNVYLTRVAVTQADVDWSGSDLVYVSSANGLVRQAESSTIDMIKEDYIGVKWLLTVTNPSGETGASQILSLPGKELLVNYGFVGNTALDYTVSLEDFGVFGSALSMTNNSATPLRVDMTRIPIQQTPSIAACDSLGLPLIVPTVVDIDAGDTASVDDQIETNTYSYVKWLVSVVEQGTGKAMAFEFVSSIAATTATDSMYSIVGDTIDIDIASAVTAGDLTLSVTNNTISTITVHVLRMPVVL